MGRAAGESNFAPGTQSKPARRRRGQRMNGTKTQLSSDNGLIREIKNRRTNRRGREDVARRAGRRCDGGWVSARRNAIERGPSIEMIGDERRKRDLNARNRPRTPQPNNSGALRPIIKLTRAFALVASDGIALIRPCTQYPVAGARITLDFPRRAAETHARTLLFHRWGPSSSSSCSPGYLFPTK